MILKCKEARRSAAGCKYACRTQKVLTRKQLNEFLQGSEGVEFKGQDRAELYGWVQRVLIAQEYAVQDKKQRGAIRAYLSKLTGRSLPG